MDRKQIKTLEYLDQLIHLRQTGSPDVLAQKLQISKTSLISMIQCMKRHQLPLMFDMRLQSYVYYGRPDYKELLFSSIFCDNNDLSSPQGKQHHPAPIPLPYPELRIV